jgi:N-formylglutamate deformylase
MPASIYTLTRGTAPLLISMPHVGTRIPAELAQRMTPVAHQIDDTDWHLERLYGFAERIGASLLVPQHSRYVIDLNRPADGSSLYPGQNTTGLCPTITFDGVPLYLEGAEPDAADIAARLATYWQPYHQALQAELTRLRELHGRAFLWEAHSIRSHVPRLFDGELPVYNFGTVDGQSCEPARADRLLALARGTIDASTVMNRRFKGGYITRAYGRPQEGIQAIQLELAQRSYMQETLPYAYDESRASVTARHLEALVTTFIED